MKKNSLIVCGVAMFTWFMIASAFKKPERVPVSSWKETFSGDLSEWMESIEDFEKLSGATKDVEAWREAFTELRLSYKKLDFLLAYLDPQLHKDFINGAPLPHLERKAPNLVILAPTGLQVIDEQVFAEEGLENRKKVLGELHTLKIHLEKFAKRNKKMYVTDRHLFESLRFGMIRLVSLGITGFDTPASSNAIAESRVVWETMYEMYELYEPIIKEKDAALGKRISRTFKKGLSFLKKSDDFDSFDRLTFIKKFANPIYGDLLYAQKALGVETMYELGNVRQALNYNATNIFANDFLDASYFVNVKEDQEIALRELGKLLFFDPILSGDGKRSCASCHDPAKGFADGLETSLAFGGTTHLDRNAPGLLNAIYAEHFFHDMRAGRLDEQIAHVVVNPKEFHTDFPSMLARIEANEYYKNAFQEIFPEREELITDSFSKALIAYMKSLSGFESSFDHYIRGESEELSDAAIRGFNLFMGKASCGTCHFAPLFSGLVPPLYQESESEVLGVPETPDATVIDSDMGRYSNRKPKEHAPFFKHSFKTTSVRNIEKTAPYMHNGIYKTLEEVVDFYNEGGGLGKGLDVENQTLPADALNLSQQEKGDLIAFMKSLTDHRTFGGKPQHLPRNKGAVQAQVGGEY